MARSTPVKLKLLSGRAHPGLAKAVAQKIGLPLSKVELGNFANGEISCRISESVRDCDVFIIQTHTDNVNDYLIEQCLMIDAAKRSSARSITAVCPFLGYARQDRKSHAREPIAAKLMVAFLQRAGATRVMSVDLHAGQIQGFFDGPFDHLIAMPVMLRQLKKLPPKKMVIVSPDAGRVKLAERYTGALGCEIAIVHKHRSLSEHNKSESRFLIGDVKGKICIIVDDMIDTAGTLCSAAELLQKNGAKTIYAAATHGIFSDPALERIEKSALDKIFVTDTLPLKFNPKDHGVEVLSVAPLIADVILAVFDGSSVSAIFGGKNQL